MSERTCGREHYQGLLSYALAKHLLAVRSTWFVAQPVPKELLEALVISFEAVGETRDGEVESAEEIEEVEPAGSSEEEATDEEALLGEEEGLSDAFVIQPDVDILLRNAAWHGDQAEPVLLLSAKTSLVDRAGQAARWKLYFDLATNPCPCHDCAECAYRKLGISMENAGAYAIKHAIVTANIYKYWFADVRYRKGELASRQTQSNTGMFELRYTTRDDDEAETPHPWQHFPQIVSVLAALSKEHELPNADG